MKFQKNKDRMNFKKLFLALFLVGLSNFIYAQPHKQIELKDSENYATIYIYRLHIRESRNNTFKINLNDTSFKVKDYSRHIIKIYREGDLKIFSKKETSDEVILNIKFGREYYIKCGIKPGIITARPELTIMNDRFGKADFENITVKNK
jgi:hypothetical protein